MKYLFFISCLISYKIGVFAQSLPTHPWKPAIDTSTFDKWLSVRPTWFDAKVVISNDGKCALYQIRESWRLPATLIIQAIQGEWSMEFPNVENAVFTEDNRKAVFIRSQDSLCLLTLGSAAISYIPQVAGFKLFKQGKAEWLAYQLNTPGRELVLYNPETGREQSFPDVSEYLLSQDGHIVVLKTESEKDSAVTQSLSWVSLPDGKRKMVWEGISASNLVLDDDGRQLAFRVEDKLNDPTAISFWYYREGTDKAVQLANNQSEGIDKELQLDEISKFSKDGSRLFIRLKEKDAVKPKPDAVKVDVWSYADARLQSQQLNDLKWTKTYTAVIHFDAFRITRLQQEDELVSGPENDDFLYMTSTKGDENESNWSAAAKGVSHIILTSSGERRPLKRNFIGSSIELSPGGQYLIGLDETWNDYYSYETGTGIIRNLTKTLPVPVLAMIERDDMDGPLYKHNRGLWALGWVDNGDVLINDEYDIWQIDPAGKKAPVNLTHGYGRKKKIAFRLAGMYTGKTIPGTGELILTAFDKTNKNSGFYSINMNKRELPQLLAMGPYQYDPGYNGRTQIKARNAEVYIVMRERATESPNYFWTNDFKTFRPLSAVYPEKKYNWLTSELVAFTTLDGRTEQAVLYRPGNFDPKKKYPVIVHYYERKSQDLNKYYKPAEPNGELDIAWFVSQGYVVFTPDIHYKTGETGQSACNSVIAAAKFLSRYEWVDTKHIGIQGHSFGGYQTNYIVTQTNLFAAAVSSSGMSDIVSNYLGFLGDHSNHDWYENRICRIGATLWENPDLYTRNSPVFYADKVTTPILTVANKKDVNVYFEQGVEWFIALRRLGKKAWMLQYDEGSHGLRGKEYKDYVIRMTQFFDHYLKGMPAPKWMTRGIPAKMKGMDDGLELDNEIKTPGQGLCSEHIKSLRD